MEKTEQPEAHLSTVYCLCIDMIRSTERGLTFSNEELRRFNLALVEQIKPHLKKLRLEEELLKFTGDGWLLMTKNTQKVEALCCLAVIMAKKFQEEIAERTILAKDEIPPLRLAVCSGGDILVILPDGRTDWVGDSARRAGRASGYCKPNEIIICEGIKGLVSRDFETEILDIEKRESEFQPKRMEERLTLYRLGEIKRRTAASSKAPEHYVYMLDAMGERAEAEAIAEEVTVELSGQAAKATAQVKGTVVLTVGTEAEDVKAKAQEIIDQVLRSWNRLIASLSDYEFAEQIVEKMKVANVTPNVVTYNTLINIAGDLTKGKELLEEMRGDGIQPNVITYNILINLSDDFNKAQELLKEMRTDGIQPDVFTYTTLMNLSDDFSKGQGLLEEMRGDGIQPNVRTYNTLINLADDFSKGQGLIEEMRGDGIQPNVVTYNTLINLADDFTKGQELLEEMHNDGIMPNAVTYTTVLSRDLSEVSADQVIDWYKGEGCERDEPMQTAIANYRRIKKISEALRICLEWPYFDTARKVMRKYPEDTLQYFEKQADDKGEICDPTFALGIAYLEWGKRDMAVEYLEKALGKAVSDDRKELVKKWLERAKG